VAAGRSRCQSRRPADRPRPPLEHSAIRIWKKLAREERLSAARRFFEEPPAEALASALGAIVKARHVRPQVARGMPREEQARALAGIADPGEGVAASLLVALHLGERRALLRAFLDAAGIAHEDGLIKDDETAALGEEKGRAAVQAIARTFPRAEVDVYLNVLWQQDPERWAVLASYPRWIEGS
jgi:hypothetical protein